MAVELKEPKPPVRRDPEEEKLSPRPMAIGGLFVVYGIFCLVDPFLARRFLLRVAGALLFFSGAGYALSRLFGGRAVRAENAPWGLAAMAAGAVLGLAPFLGLQLVTLGFALLFAAAGLARAASGRLLHALPAFVVSAMILVAWELVGMAMVGRMLGLLFLLAGLGLIGLGPLWP